SFQASSGPPSPRINSLAPRRKVPLRPPDAVRRMPAPPPPAFVQRSPFYVALVAVAALLLIALAFFTPRYETNDDAGMNLIAGGRLFVDWPDEHLPFSNVLVGLALKGLYGWAPGVPWYGSYLLAVSALGLLGCCYALLRDNPTGLRLLPAGAFLLAFGLPCLVALQFTRAAFLAALGGLMLG